MKTKALVTTSLLTGIIIVFSLIAIPLFGPVPATLQTFILVVIAVAFRPKLAITATTLYILIGLIGFPVFSNATGGLSVIVGPTGGFILSFPIMVAIISICSRNTKNIVTITIAVIIATFVNFIIGTIYFHFVTDISLSASLTYTVYPFIVPTIIKTVIGITIGLTIKEHTLLQKKGLIN